MSNTKTLVVLCGPTAIGKTIRGIELAKNLNAEILSADSRQFYKEMNIGTAKPDIKKLGQVNHHFIGHLSIHDYYNVSKYEAESLTLLEKLFKQSNYALLVGGSGLYIDAVCKGVDDLPDPDNKLREALNNKYQKYGISILQNELKQLDPEYYEKVDRSNPVRLIRAIEVCLITGKKYSDLRVRNAKQRNFNILKIGLITERGTLFNRINQRVDNMIIDGLLEEVRSLYKYRSLNALKTVGYRELFKYLDGQISLTQAIRDIKTNTRRYAKRQITWFKRDVSIHWFKPEEQAKMLNLISDESTAT